MKFISFRKHNHVFDAPYPNSFSPSSLPCCTQELYFVSRPWQGTFMFCRACLFFPVFVDLSRTLATAAHDRQSRPLQRTREPTKNQCNDFIIKKSKKSEKSGDMSDFTYAPFEYEDK